MACCICNRYGSEFAGHFSIFLYSIISPFLYVSPISWKDRASSLRLHYCWLGGKIFNLEFDYRGFETVLAGHGSRRSWTFQFYFGSNVCNYGILDLRLTGEWDSILFPVICMKCRWFLGLVFAALNAISYIHRHCFHCPEICKFWKHLLFKFGTFTIIPNMCEVLFTGNEKNALNNLKKRSFGNTDQNFENSRQLFNS